MQVFTEKVISVIKSIPEGYVMTYGQIARVAGNPRSARQVARILHSMSRKHELPWHRVINAKGEISIKEEALYFEQKLTLEMEGIVFSEGKVDLPTYQFHPEEQ